MDHGIYLFFENVNIEHFTCISELYNSATGCYDPLYGRIIIDSINWSSFFPWVVHFFSPLHYS